MACLRIGSSICMLLFYLIQYTDNVLNWFTGEVKLLVRGVIYSCFR